MEVTNKPIKYDKPVMLIQPLMSANILARLIIPQATIKDKGGASISFSLNAPSEKINNNTQTNSAKRVGTKR